MKLFNEYLKTTQRGSILVSWHFPFLSGTQNCAGAEFSVEDIYQNYIHEFGILLSLHCKFLKDKGMKVMGKSFVIFIFRELP